MEFYDAIGRRKNATARIRLVPGQGKVAVNGRELLEYFKREVLKMVIEQPLIASDTLGKFNITANINGGGLSGQAEAMRLGIARALLKWNEELRPEMRANGFLTRDPRRVERKKYGRPKARKRFQFSKR
ncbi:MAG: 30S ribosomal protein S9 [Caldithrix sp. RBG_13_44_9]|jgi:small subunit ribosomal protein S9|nr:MAG: 30S ribosomal protein S9 [Caldithrix sp. RBG_13_44_9]